ncbi:hypothetical protein MRB53_002356 [Persea americana]|uniref:Uncharacterized protein n=1 Tax=Persea americana TaxID=3435 RepID=A0ACC2MV66_PERAE|nr:hypothetical protein MRB53_002356 [Persea americana]
MARESAAVANGAAMGGRAAAARSGFRGVAAACVWRKKMGSPGLRESLEMEGMRKRAMVTGWRRDGRRGISERGFFLEEDGSGGLLREEDGVWRRWVVRDEEEGDGHWMERRWAS